MINYRFWNPYFYHSKLITGVYIGCERGVDRNPPPSPSYYRHKNNRSDWKMFRNHLLIMSIENIWVFLAYIVKSDVLMEPIFQIWKISTHINNPSTLVAAASISSYWKYLSPLSCSVVYSIFKKSCPIHIVIVSFISYYKKWAKTYWTYSNWTNFSKSFRIDIVYW